MFKLSIIADLKVFILPRVAELFLLIIADFKFLMIIRKLVGIVGNRKIKIKNIVLLLMSRTFSRIFFDFLSGSLYNSIVHH